MKDLIDFIKVFFTSPSILIAFLLVLLVGKFIIEASTGLAYLFITIPLWIWFAVAAIYYIEGEKEKRGYNARREEEEIDRAMKVMREQEATK